MFKYYVFDLATIIPMIDAATSDTVGKRWVVRTDSRFVKYFFSKQEADAYCHELNNKVKKKYTSKYKRPSRSKYRDS